MTEPVPEPQPTEPTPTEPPPESNPPTEPPSEPATPEGEPAPEEPAQPEPETEPPQPEGLSQADWEARFQKADKAWDTYAKRIGAIFEEDATALVPLTISPSAPPGFLHPADAGRIPDEVKGPLLDFLGVTQEKDYPLDPSKVACSLCKGEGKTATESKVPDYRVLICRICNGTGLAPIPGMAENGPGTAALVPVPAGMDAPPQPQPDEDVWHTPRLLPDGSVNPNYGRTVDHWDYNFPVGRVG